MEANYELKNKLSGIKSVLEQKTALTKEERNQTEGFLPFMADLLDDLFMGEAKTIHMSRTMGRGSPEVDGALYYVREKNYLKREMPELNKKLDSILAENNSEEKLAIIEKACNTSCGTYSLIDMIDLLSRKYSSKQDKPVLKEISQYTMHGAETVMCMMMVESGQSERIMELSRKGLLRD